MKRVLAIFLAALMFASGALALAEGEVAGVDISALSDEDLLALRGAVEDEFAKRFLSLDSGRIYDGIYIVGEDIAPGKYVMSCTDAGDSIVGYIVDIGSAPDENGERKGVFYESADPGSELYLSLEEGMAVRIEHVVEGYLTPVKSSWAVKDTEE